jgi:hypothetical protein
MLPSPSIRHARTLVTLVSLTALTGACGLSVVASDSSIPSGDISASGDGAAEGATGSSNGSSNGGSSGGSNGDGATSSSPSTSLDAATDADATADAESNVPGLGPPPVLLGTAGAFAILAKAAITDVPASVIHGDVGLSPAAASGITGFTMTKAGTKWTAPEVFGSIFAADNDVPTPAIMTLAIGAMETAYTDAASRALPGAVDLGAGEIGGLTLAPGLYTWGSAVTITNDVTLAGAANDVWIFQVSGELTLSAGKLMTFAGKGRAKNVFWQVAGAVTLGGASHTEGTVMSKTAITVETAASVNGRLLAQTAVTIGAAIITAPAP